MTTDRLLPCDMPEEIWAVSFTVAGELAIAASTKSDSWKNSVKYIRADLVTRANSCDKPQMPDDVQEAVDHLQSAFFENGSTAIEQSLTALIREVESKYE